jgi:phage FluMu protein Com
MSQRVTCPSCAKILAVPPGAAGKAGQCPGCKTKFAFPSPPAEEDPLAGWDAIMRGEVRGRVDTTAPRAPEIHELPTVREPAPPIRVRPTATRYIYEVTPQNVFWAVIAFWTGSLAFILVGGLIVIALTAIFGGIFSGLRHLAQ